jgi:hypothetical protein
VSIYHLNYWMTYEVLVSWIHLGTNCKNVSCLPLDSNAQSTIIWIARLITFFKYYRRTNRWYHHAYISNHGNTTGESYMRGHFRALGYYVPRRRVRAGINRVYPRTTALRWGALVSRRVYSVPWPN